MTTDAQQVAAWNALLVSAKKWGRPVRWQELEGAVAMIERLKCPDCDHAIANYREVRATRNPGPPYGPAPLAHQPESQDAIWARLAPGPQQPPTVAPRTDGKREDRAQAYNTFAKPLIAQGMSAKEIGAKWRELKGKP